MTMHVSIWNLDAFQICFFSNKWWNFSLNIVHTEVSDKNIKLEDQKAQSSSQVQLKKQKSLGGEIFTSKYNDCNYLRLF